MNPSFIATIKKICCKRPNDRSSMDIETLFQLTKYNKVFASRSEGQTNTFHKPCCYHLRYEHCEANNYVFLYGSVGNKFYIILSGTIAVEVPRRDNTDKFEEVLQLTDGDCFGELALESEKPRQASIKCKTPCHFIYLEKKDYKECLGKVVKEKRNMLVEFLISLPLFSGFTRGSLTKIGYGFKEKVLRKGHFVYKEGDIANEMYIVESGELSFYKKLKENNDKKKICTRKKSIEINIANICKGELFGAEEMLSEELRTSSCKCISEQALVYFISKNVSFT